MSLLSEYDERTAWKYQRVQGAFPTPERVREKVREDGSYAPFTGSTVVFRMDRSGRKLLRVMQQALHQELEEAGLLADPLPPHTFHMTLHDLFVTTDRPLMTGSARQAADIVRGLQQQYEGRTVTLKPDRIVSMVSTSIVLMLRPVSEEDYALLMALYRAFDCIAPLNYPLTPHVTLAYYRPGLLDGDRLGDVLAQMAFDPAKMPDITFSLDSLTAQVFTDMVTYHDVPERVCFCCDGGLNRSVMAAAIVSHLADERSLPIEAEARAALPDTAGKPVPDAVRSALEEAGIRTDTVRGEVRYLSEAEEIRFSHFAAISPGALQRFSSTAIPDARVKPLSRRFFGIPDPAYGEITHAQAVSLLRSRAEKWLAEWEHPLKEG